MTVSIPIRHERHWTKARKAVCYLFPNLIAHSSRRPSINLLLPQNNLHFNMSESWTYSRASAGTNCSSRIDHNFICVENAGPNPFQYTPIEWVALPWDPVLNIKARSTYKYTETQDSRHTNQAKSLNLQVPIPTSLSTSKQHALNFTESGSSTGSTYQYDPTWLILVDCIKSRLLWRHDLLALMTLMWQNCVPRPRMPIPGRAHATQLDWTNMLLKQTNGQSWYKLFESIQASTPHSSLYCTIT